MPKVLFWICCSFLPEVPYSESVVQIRAYQLDKARIAQYVDPVWLLSSRIVNELVELVV